MIDFRDPQPVMPHPHADDFPVQEAVVELDYRPRPWQLRVHQQLKRFSVVVLARRSGKTVMALNTLISAALRIELPNARFAYVCPFKKQARMVAWSYLRYFVRNIPDVVIRETDLSVTFPHNGATIYLEGMDNAEAMRGGYLDGIVIDELASVNNASEIWGEIVRPMLADRIGWALIIGTVKGVNFLHELYTRALSDPSWYCIKLDCYEAAALSPDEIEQARGEMTEAQFRQEMLCDFSAAVDNQLIAMQDVEAAQARSYSIDDYQLAPKILGVDVARYGDDRSVIQKRQGLVAFDPITFQEIDNMSLAAQVAHHIVTWQPDAVFIDAGRGEGVIDRLRQLGYDVIGVDFGGKSGSPEYYNKRSEMWGKMALWVKEGGALPKHSALMVDLCTPTVDFKDVSGRMRLESKDDMRKRGAKSPDIADALALTFAFPVAPTRFANAQDARHHHPALSGASRSLTDYDPFDDRRW